MTTEPDDNTLDNAGKTGTAGTALADKLTNQVITVIGVFPGRERREAVARIVALAGRVAPLCASA